MADGRYSGFTIYLNRYDTLCFN